MFNAETARQRLRANLRWQPVLVQLQALSRQQVEANLLPEGWVVYPVTVFQMPCD